MKYLLVLTVIYGHFSGSAAISTVQPPYPDLESCKAAAKEYSKTYSLYTYASCIPAPSDAR